MPPPSTKTSNDSVSSNCVVINVDGACINNGQCADPQLAEAGFGVFWSENNQRNLSASFPSTDDKMPTNNRAELYAALFAIGQAIKHNLEEIMIRSDSEYVVQGAVSYLHTWKSDGSLDRRKNDDLWQMLDKLLTNMKLKIHWEHVAGHSGDPRNTAADKLANNAAMGQAMTTNESVLELLNIIRSIDGKTDNVVNLRTRI
jgi:ribonuclease HI